MERSSTVVAPPAGVCGERGYLAPLVWTSVEAAAELAEQLELQSDLGNVTANPHWREDWARELVRAPGLVEHVCGLIGPDIAVENTFLMVKRPGGGFAVPAHQDGINDRIELDPARAVAVWVAITHATLTNGCLAVVPGSQTLGYVPYHRAGDGPLTTGIAGGTSFVPVPVKPGQACALDVRLIHRSGLNSATSPRIGLNIRYVAPGGLHVRSGEPPRLFPLTGNRW